MPIYEYLCPNCKPKIEKHYPAIPDDMADVQYIQCPNCNARAELVISIVNYKLPYYVPKNHLPASMGGEWSYDHKTKGRDSPEGFTGYT